MQLVSLIIPVILLLVGVALIIIGVVALGVATDVAGRTDAFVYESSKLIAPDITLLTWLSNSSEQAFCIEHNVPVIFYNITNGDAVSTTGAQAEFNEVSYNFTRTQCFFGLQELETQNGPLDSFPRIGTYLEDGSVQSPLVPGFDPDGPYRLQEVVDFNDRLVGVTASTFFTPWAVGSTTANSADDSITTINNGYIVYMIEDVTNRGAGVYVANHENKVLYDAIAVHTADMTGQDLADAAAPFTSLPGEQLKWLITGTSTATRPTLQNAENVSLALNSYANFRTFDAYITASADANASVSGPAVADLTNYYDLTTGEATALQAWFTNYTQSVIYNIVSDLLDAGSGPLATRKPLELLANNSDPLFAYLGKAAQGLNIGFGATTGTGSSLLPRTAAVDPASAQTLTINTFRMRAYYESAGHVTMMRSDSRVHNYTDDIRDDCKYFYTTNAVTGFTSCHNWVIPWSGHGIMPNGWVDENGEEYPGTVTKTKDGADYMSCIMNMDGYPYDNQKCNNAGEYTFDGVTVSAFEYDAAYWDNHSNGYGPLVPGLFAFPNPELPLKALASRDLNNAGVFENTTITGIVRESEWETPTVFIHGRSGLITGALVQLVMVLKLPQLSLFPQHQLTAGFYPVYGGIDTIANGFTSHWKTSPCYTPGLSPLKINICKQIAAVEQAHELAMGTLIFICVAGGLAILGAIFLAIIGFKS